MRTRTTFNARTGRHSVAFWCPACEEPHVVPVDGAGAWRWDGDRERPTLQPSVRVTCSAWPSGGRWPTDDEHAAVMRGERLQTGKAVCHSVVTAGRIAYCGDCTHALAGQTVDMPEWPARAPDHG